MIGEVSWEKATPEDIEEFESRIDGPIPADYQNLGYVSEHEGPTLADATNVLGPHLAVNAVERRSANE